jgi:hypothetical protein
MVTLIVAKLEEGKYIIGEYNSETNTVNNCFQLITILINSTFHYNLKPLILPFCLAKSVNISGHKLNEYVEIDLNLFDNLVEEYLKIKNEIGTITKKPEITKVHLH